MSFTFFYLSIDYVFFASVRSSSIWKYGIPQDDPCTIKESVATEQIQTEGF